MRNPAKLITAASAVASLLGALALSPQLAVAAEGASPLEEGQALAFDRKKGNCLACHLIEGGNMPGNIGPPLVAMKARFPDRAVLRAQIWDATKANPDTIMPPFGRHEILTEGELEKVVDYIHSL